MYLLLKKYEKPLSCLLLGCIGLLFFMFVSYVMPHPTFFSQKTHQMLGKKTVSHKAHNFRSSVSIEKNLELFNIKIGEGPEIDDFCKIKIRLITFEGRPETEYKILSVAALNTPPLHTFKAFLENMKQGGSRIFPVHKEWMEALFPSYPMHNTLRAVEIHLIAQENI